MTSDTVTTVEQRIRLGIISPDDGINDDEFWRYAPPDGPVTLLWTRCCTPRRFEPISVQMVGSYGDASLVKDAARTLAITRPHAVGFSCNSCTFVHGARADEQIRQAMSAACANCPATTVTYAQVEVLRALDATRVALGAPYRNEVTAKLGDYFDSQGITVVSSRSLGLESEWQIGNTPSMRWYDLCREIDTADAEAIVLACSGIRAFDVHARVERDLRKPLVTAPGALIWHLSRLAGAVVRTPGAGILMEEH